MRCAYPVTYYAFATATTSQRVVVNTFQFSDEMQDCEATEYVLMTYQEAKALHMNPFYLDAQAALQIGGAMWLAMAAAWCIRLIYKFLLNIERSDHD